MADEEIRDLLRKNLEINKENNRLLRKMRRSAIISTIIWIIWYGILIGGPVFIYYYLLQPYIGVLMETYGNGVENIQDFGNQIPGLKNLIGGGGGGGD
jgi:uncharacterized membrane protein (DUF485 family)